jgi:hypothetical protein
MVSSALAGVTTAVNKKNSIEKNPLVTESRCCSIDFPLFIVVMSHYQGHRPDSPPRLLVNR